MTTVKRLVLALVLDLALFFNLERLSFGDEYYHFITIQGFVYGVGLLAVISVVVLPQLRRWSVWPSLALWLMVYTAGKFLVFKSPNHPAFGEFNTFVTLAEVALLALSIFIAHALGRALNDFEQAVENITLSGLSHRFRNIEDASEDIETELARSRRHHEPLSVIVIEVERESIRATLNCAVEEVQKAMMTRYVMASMASVLTRVLRRTDMVLEPGDPRRFIIFSPETDADNSGALMRHIQTHIAGELQVELRCGVAVFPKDALTFDELVRKAEQNLPTVDDHALVQSYRAVESREGS